MHIIIKRPLTCSEKNRTLDLHIIEKCQIVIRLQDIISKAVRSNCSHFKHIVDLKLPPDTRHKLTWYEAC